MDSERWQRVAHLYEAALEREPAERDAFLAEACVGDDELRCELDALIAHDSTPILIDRPMLEAAAAVLDDEEPQLAVGERFGPYSIDRFLGAGGMGQVYRATDTRLDRTVAIKILPSAAAVDGQSRARFQREAKAIAALTHPHICTLHDIGHQDGIDFLVMEYLEGETLAARLAKGRLPLEQALNYSVEIADALAAAHRHGIIHRDLKPGNIMLSKGGAKLLDFGLAKSVTSLIAGAPSHLATSPDLTAQGTIAGTFQYMAPEQLEGKEADARTDVFSFGAVVYEMLTGRKAFEGKSQASLVGAIMHAEPPAITALRPLTPSAVDRIVKTCLAKDPDDRWQTARDLSRELRWVVREEATPAAHLRRPITRIAAPVAIVGAIVAALTGYAAWTLLPSLSRPDGVARFGFTLPEDLRFTRPNRHAIAFSPDGSRIVMAVDNQLYVRNLDSEAIEPIAGTNQDVGLPFFSPDSRQVAFWGSARGGVDGALKRVPINGGAPVVICDTRFPFGASWGFDGRILMGGGPEGIVRVSAEGGQPEVIITVNPGELATSPQMLPDGKSVLFTLGKQGTEVDLNRQRNWDEAQVVVQSLESGERKVLFAGGSDARYSPTGHIVYAFGGALWARRFELSRLEVAGDPSPILAGIRGDRSGRFTSGAFQFSFSGNGAMAYIPGARRDAFPTRTLALVDLNGKVRSLDLPAGEYHSPRFSLPDGKQITLYTSDGVIWIHDLSGTKPIRRLTLEGGYLFPMWTRDGRVVYRSTVEGQRGVFSHHTDGSAVAERLTDAGMSYFPYSVSPDGKTLLLLTERGEFDQTGSLGQGIVTLSLTGDRTPTVLFRGGRGDVMFSPTFSPDGRWIAYEWRRENRNNIYVDPFPPTGVHVQVTTEGGSTPMWSPDGKRLLYVRGPAAGESRSTFYAVDVLQSGKSFDVGKSTELFALDGHFFAGSGPGNVVDLSPDGKQFVTLLLPPGTERESARPQVSVVLNWFAELNRMAPSN
jgi:Tol biopolymer transport system component